MLLMKFMMARYTSGVSVIINMMAWGYVPFSNIEAKWAVASRLPSDLSKSR